MAAQQKSLRPSRDERTPFISAINEALAEGRINDVEHSDRIELAEAAVSFDDLDDLVADIPFTWRDRQAEAARRTGRRRFLLGAVGCAAVAVASWAGTRTWVEAATAREGAPPGPTVEPSDSGAGAESESPKSAADDAVVPTELVQVDLWSKEAMTTAMDFVVSAEMTEVASVSGSGSGLRVEGRSESKGPMAISFSRGVRPEIEKLDLVAEETVKPAKLRGIDLARLHAEAKKTVDLGPDDGSHYLRIEYWPDLWTIGIRGSGEDAEIFWRIDGTTRYDPDREYF